MPYTLWSRGRLLGQSTLGYAQARPGLRAGDFEPTELGHMLMSIITGVGPAITTLYEVAKEFPPATGQADGDSDFPTAVRQTTVYADAVSIADELESLALELHDEYDQVVPTEHIWINDTERLLARAEERLQEAQLELSPELEAEIEHDVEELFAYFHEREQWNSGDESWEESKPFARYQILVTLDEGPQWTDSTDDWADDGDQ
jgi:hypothetical protein